MKKLMIVPMMAFGMLFATSANAQEYGDKKEMEKKAEKVEMQDKYSKIETAALPAAVKASVERDFEASTVSEAYVSKDGAYKLLLINEDGEKGWVYADKTGKWIKPHAKSKVKSNM